MENNVFNMTSNETQRNSIATDGTPSISLVQPDLNIQNQIMSGYPVISTLQGEEPSGFGFAPIVSSHPNQILHDQFSEGTPISAAALATLLATRSCLQESIINNLAPSVFPSEIFRTYASNDCINSSSSSFVTTSNTGFDGALGIMNSRWDFDKFLALSDPAGKPPDRAGFQPFQLVESMDPNGINHHCSSKFSNELSLSLATLQPSVFCGKTVPDQCSDISSNGINHNCLNETGLGSDQTSFSSKELSLSFGSYKHGQFSHIISGSRYLGVVQEILAEIASYSLENLNQLGIGANLPYHSSGFARRGNSLAGSDEFTEGDAGEVQIEPLWQRQEVEVKKAQLLALLQVVDDRYTQCLDETHTVISAFHAATELNPQIHARFALHTISFLYKNLRERISNQILAMGANNPPKENDGSTFETSFIQKQWALQQLKRREHQLWRPQRGLPERSVSVLRAWMFQNFLHPYPKDAEKHLLAVKSGLTRSQVSNWFINARVRLWKPMIEEMYAEMNRRKARRNDEAAENNQRAGSGRVNIDNQRFKLN